MLLCRGTHAATLFCTLLAVCLAGRPASAEFTLTIQALGPPGPLLRRAATDFQDISVGVKIVTAVPPRGINVDNGYLDLVQNALSGPNPPDLIEVTPSLIAPLAASGSIIEIDPHLVYTAPIAPALAHQAQPIGELSRYDDRNWAVTLTFDMTAIALDANRFAEAGLDPNPNWNWYAFSQDGLKLSRFGANRPAVAGALLADDPAALLPFFHSNGGSYTTPDLADSNFYTEPNVETAGWLQDAFRRKALGLSDTPFDALREGDAAMAVTRAGPVIAAQIDGQRGLILTQLPFSPFSQKRTGLLIPGQMFAINAHAVNGRLALAFLQFYLNLSEQDYATIYGRLPTRADIPLSRVPADSRDALTLLSTYVEPLMPAQYALLTPQAPLWQPFAKRFPDLTSGRLDARRFVQDIDAALHAAFIHP